MSLTVAAAVPLRDTHAQARRAPEGADRQPRPGLAENASIAHSQTQSSVGSAAQTWQMLHLQRTVGNQAVGRMLGTTIQRGGRRAGAPLAAPLPVGGLPKVSSIAASASGIAGGSSFGDHATLFLAISTGSPAEPTMAYRFIDLVLDQDSDRKGAVMIRILPLKGNGWPSPQTSTTWEISDANAEAAFAQAREFQANQAKYTYSRLGIGPRRYNCALFVEKILKAAGVKQSAGLIASTPLEVAKGRKLPERRKREKQVTAPRIPPQYDV